MAVQILLPTQQLNLHEGQGSSQSLRGAMSQGKARVLSSNTRLPFTVDPAKTLEKNLGGLVDIVDNYYQYKYQKEKEVLFNKAVNEFQEADREDLISYSRLKGQDAVDGWQDYLKQREARRKEFEQVWDSHPEEKAKWIKSIDDIQLRNKLNALDYKVKQVDKMNEEQLQASLSNSLIDFQTNMASPRAQLYYNAVVQEFDKAMDYAGTPKTLADGSLNPVYQNNRRQLFDQALLHSVDFYTGMKQFGVASNMLEKYKGDMTPNTYSTLKVRLTRAIESEQDRQERLREHAQRVSANEYSEAFKPMNEAQAATFKADREKQYFMEGLVDLGLAKSEIVKDKDGNEIKQITPLIDFSKVNDEQKKMLESLQLSSRSKANKDFVKLEYEKQQVNNVKSSALFSARDEIKSRLIGNNSVSLLDESKPLELLAPESREMLLTVYGGDAKRAEEDLIREIDIGRNINRHMSDRIKNNELSDAEIAILFPDMAAVSKWQVINQSSLDAQALGILSKRINEVNTKLANGEALDKGNEAYKQFLDHYLRSAGIKGNDRKKWSDKEWRNAAIAERLAGKMYLTVSKEYIDKGLPPTFNALAYAEQKRFDLDFKEFQNKVKAIDDVVDDVVDELEDVIADSKRKDEFKAFVFAVALDAFDTNGENALSEQALIDLVKSKDDERHPTNKLLKTDKDPLTNSYDNEISFGNSESYNNDDFNYYGARGASSQTSHPLGSSKSKNGKEDSK